MAVVFSKVSLLADNGSNEEFLCSGIPDREEDLRDWTAYDNFLEDNPDAESIDVTVESYSYGEGERFIANEYEVAAFTQRGEGFLTHPGVNNIGTSKFVILTDNEDFGIEL